MSLGRHRWWYHLVSGLVDETFASEAAQVPGALHGRCSVHSREGPSEPFSHALVGVEGVGGPPPSLRLAAVGSVRLRQVQPAAGPRASRHPRALLPLPVRYPGTQQREERGRREAGSQGGRSVWVAGEPAAFQAQPDPQPPGSHPHPSAVSASQSLPTSLAAAVTSKP